jgi:hypothetical protein
VTQVVKRPRVQSPVLGVRKEFIDGALGAGAFWQGSEWVKALRWEGALCTKKLQDGDGQSPGEEVSSGME